MLAQHKGLAQIIASNKCNAIPKEEIGMENKAHEDNEGRNTTNTQLKTSITLTIPHAINKLQPHHAKNTSVNTNEIKKCIESKLPFNFKDGKTDKIKPSKEIRKDNCPSTQDTTGIRYDNLSKNQSREQKPSSQRDYKHHDNNTGVIYQSDTDEKLNKEEIKCKIKQNLTTSHINCKSNDAIKKNLSVQINLNNKINTEGTIDCQNKVNNTQDSENSKVKNLMGQLKSITTGEPFKENRNLPKEQKNRVVSLVKPTPGMLNKYSLDYLMIDQLSGRTQKSMDANDDSPNINSARPMVGLPQKVIKGIYEDELNTLKDKLMYAFSTMRLKIKSQKSSFGVSVETKASPN